jgi:sensor histidine kinase YesM
MKRQFSFLDFLFNNWWLRHILFWIFILNYFTWGFGIGETGDVKSQYIRILEFIPGFMAVVYPLLYFLIPQFLVKKKYSLFILGFIGLIGFAILYAEIFQLNYHSTKKFFGFDYRWGRNILPFIHVTGIATAIKFIKYAYFQEDRATKARQQKTIAELELLKAQIHPHFLFNTLNNLFAHTLRNSTDSPQIVSRLSNLLRFMIYESRQDFIPLAEETKLLNNYIDLEKLRYGQELDISVNFSGNQENKLIRPLLLLPLIENSFKHGMSQQLEKKWIRLQIDVDQNTFYFKLANSKDPKQIKTEVRGKSKGIGMENVRRRLELLYPGKHTLEVLDQDDVFLVKIELEIIDENAFQKNESEHSAIDRFQDLQKARTA